MNRIIILLKDLRKECLRKRLTCLLKFLLIELGLVLRILFPLGSLSRARLLMVGETARMEEFPTTGASDLG
jgi:hypothetical protein